MRERLKRPISPATIRRIVKLQFGADAKAVKITTMHGGLFNTSYKIRLDDARTVVLRIAPPRDKPLLACEAGLLEREIHFMRALKKHHLPIPKLLCADLSKRVIDRNYIITEFCEGYNAFYRLNQLTPHEQDAVLANWAATRSKSTRLKTRKGGLAPRPRSNRSESGASSSAGMR